MGVLTYIPTRQEPSGVERGGRGVLAYVFIGVRVTYTVCL